MANARTQEVLSLYTDAVIPVDSNARREKNQEKAGIREAHPEQIQCLCKLQLFCLLGFFDRRSIVATTGCVIWTREECANKICGIAV